MSKSTRREPTHRIYAVERRDTRRAHWMDIGKAFRHKDGKGFDLELQSMPLTAEELVVRTAAERILPNGLIAEHTAARRRFSKAGEVALPADRVRTHACL